MKITSLGCLLWVFTTASLVIAATSNGTDRFKVLEGEAASLLTKENVREFALLSEDPNSFPFEIKASKFVRKSDGNPVFLNIICYSPIEPNEDYDGKISEERIKDDLRRWEAYKDLPDPVVIRLYSGPTENDPNRTPRIFYDGIRDLGFWIIRDIYFAQDFCDSNYTEKGEAVVDTVIAEVKNANALDLIFAWEIGNEFISYHVDCWNANVTEQFINDMCSYLKAEVGQLGRNDVSNWVTWASWPPYDPLHTDGDSWEPKPNSLDYISYNAYSYWPEQIQTHQPGPVTGTPYQGYLASLKSYYQTQNPGKPVVISEVGFSDSNKIIHASRCHPWYPTYRYGAMTPEQVAEGLMERYFDARLLCDDGEPNILIAGLAVFSWNDEWWKFEYGVSDIQEDEPEEHFGISKFVEKTNGEGYQLRYKLQQEIVHAHYSLNFDNDINIIEDVVPDDNSVGVNGITWVRAKISQDAVAPVRLRWECSRGYIIGDPNCVADPDNFSEPNSVIFYMGRTALGPATVTAVAIDANGNVDTASITIDINIPPEPNIEILTVGPGIKTGKASGRVSNVDLEQYKLICYVYSHSGARLDIQPFDDMKSIWINKEGYWWTRFHNTYDDKLFCWLVPQGYNPPNDVINVWEPNWSPDCNYIAEANTVNMDPNYYSDSDNDLLPDYWELEYFGKVDDANDRYSDSDGDGANNLEEFLAGMLPTDPNDNDIDKDGLLDNWERRFFGDPNFYNVNDDPDGDGLTNSEELDLGLHPVRVAVDKDQDWLPDTWEMRWFGTLAQDPNENFDDDCFDNLMEYELGLDPIICMGNLNCDWYINLVDFSMFAAYWLETDCNKPDWCFKTDLNRDGKVTLADLCVLAENWLVEL